MSNVTSKFVERNDLQHFYDNQFYKKKLPRRRSCFQHAFCFLLSTYLYRYIEHAHLYFFLALRSVAVKSMVVGESDSWNQLELEVFKIELKKVFTTNKYMYMCAYLRDKVEIAFSTTFSLVFLLRFHSSGSFALITPRVHIFINIYIHICTVTVCIGAEKMPIVFFH